MTVDYNDGKIHGWNGGECPVHPKTMVECWTESGERDISNAEDWFWSCGDQGDNLIAFRVIKVFKEPKTIWVNEWKDGSVCAYKTENMAKYNAYDNSTRIAVKYQEVIED